MEALTGIIPRWLAEWFKVYLVPLLKAEGRNVAGIIFKGVADTLLFIGLPLTISVGSQMVWNARYNLAPQHQEQVRKWASISSLVAYAEDVPAAVPLVLWYKEAGMREENPANCEGIMGFYTAVQTGAMPCFPPGPIPPEEVVRQLRLGARTFKAYCPEIRYTTYDPALLKRCYLYYNAGPRSRMNPDDSAYVMNGYDAAHQNMVHTDITGRATRLKALGAWPVHLAIQAQLAHQRQEVGVPRFLSGPALLLQEGLDRLWARRAESPAEEGATTEYDVSLLPRCRSRQDVECVVPPRYEGETSLQPLISPVMLRPDNSAEVTCGLLPGVELVTPKRSLVLAPLAGALTRYTDASGQLAVHIENDEWSVWLTGLRSYVRAPGTVEAGTPVGAIGGSGTTTAGVRYSVYDKVANNFVDPVGYLPAGSCPASE